MNKIIIFIIFCTFINCGSFSQNKVEFTAKKIDLPIKIFYRGNIKDSAFINLCFPKKIVYENKASTSIKLSRYNLNQNEVGINNRYYPTYKFDDSLVYAKGFRIEAFKKDSLDIYYGFRLKEHRSKLDSLLKGKTPVQKKADWLIYDIPITPQLKEWANHIITDSMMKARLNFKLHSKEKGFFYKSLDIELFED